MRKKLLKRALVKVEIIEAMKERLNEQIESHERFNHWNVTEAKKYQESIKKTFEAIKWMEKRYQKTLKELANV